MTTDERIDLMLKHLGDGRRHYFFDACVNVLNEDGGDFDDMHSLLFKEMEELDLVERSSDIVCQITPNGRRILKEYSGWIEYQNSIQNDHKEVIRLRADKEAFERRHTKANTNLQIGLLVVAIFAAGMTGYSFYQANKNTALEDQLDKATKQRDSLLKVTDDRNRLLETTGKQIQKLILKIDSLSQPPSQKK